MRLNAQGLADRKQWEDRGYNLPKFDREAVTAATKENPFWIHFGPGNIFRAFQANVVQNLLNEGLLDRGIVAAEGYDYEIIEKMNHPHDDYNLLVTLKADGNVEKTVIGSVVESLTVDSTNEKDFSSSSLPCDDASLLHRLWRNREKRGWKIRCWYLPACNT